MYYVSNEIVIDMQAAYAAWERHGIYEVTTKDQLFTGFILKAFPPDSNIRKDTLNEIQRALRARDAFEGDAISTSDMFMFRTACDLITSEQLN